MKVLGQSVGRILVYSDPVNMRKSFDGLIGLVENELKKDSLSGTLFVFCNRRKNYMKGIVWHRTGYVLLAKRLESGRFYFHGEGRCQMVGERAFALMLDGIKVGVW